MNWQNTPEWLNIIKNFEFLRDLKHSNYEKDFFEFWMKNKNLTFYDFEIEFRKNKNIYYRCFAEDPEFTKYNKGGIPLDQNGQPKKYLFCRSTKDLLDTIYDFRNNVLMNKEILKD